MIWGFWDDFIHSSGIIFFAPFLATSEAVAPLSNDPIMSGKLRESFRHLEQQNLSIFSDSIGRARMVQQFQRRGWVENEEYSCFRRCDCKNRASMVQQFRRRSQIRLENEKSLCIRVGIKHIIYKWCEADLQGPSLAALGV